MAVLPCKRVLILVLVFVLFCCFLNTTIEARSLGVADQIKNNNNVQNNEKVADGDLKVHGEEHFTNTDDLVTMDYTPASRKPPIHN